MSRVGALIHFYPPWRNAGSETVAAELLKAAVQAGHEATVWVTNKDSMRTWTGREPETVVDGVRVVRVRNSLVGASHMRAWKPDVVLSHHDHATQAIKTAKLIGARSVFAVHNDMDLNRRPLSASPDLVLFNSGWVAESLKRFGTPSQSLIFHPPLTPDRHLVDRTGDAITLINLNEHKGANLFYKLAESMPDRKFLGVVGGHGVQVIRRRIPNVQIMEHGPDMRRVWERTRVLLMPSVYESYGLTAVEAGVNGIPTIANPTPGLVENLGPGGLFADRESPADWQKILGGLDDPDTYNQASFYARTRADLAMAATRQALTEWTEWIG